MEIESRGRKLKAQGRDPISLERGKVREAEPEPPESHSYRGKAARGANSHVALKLQTEELVLRDGEEERRSREIL